MVRKVTIDRVILIVLDALGTAVPQVMPDEAAAAAPVQATRQANGLRLPNLERLGLGNVWPLAGVARVGTPMGACGKLARRSPSPDSPTGCWELTGLEIEEPFATFPNGFPNQVIEALESRTGRGVLGNRQASGQAMLDELAAEHMQSGDWIVYTSMDSVLELAAHDDVVPRDELDNGCRVARRLVAPHRVSRVIARPFKGPHQGGYEFTSRRREYLLPPPRPTVLDSLKTHGLSVVGIGRIGEYFADQGLVEKVNSQGNTDAMIKTVEAMGRLDHGLFMTHLANVDDHHRHPPSPAGHFHCLEEFDVQMAMLLSRAGDTDLLLLTADGSVTAGSETRSDLVPILAVGPAKAAGVDLGVRQSFADVGATIAEVFGVEPTEAGESFLKDIA